MGRPRIKINVKKEINNKLRKICRELWEIQFAPEFTGPNQNASCENCFFYLSGDCIDWIPPEKCIEESALNVLLKRLEEKTDEKES